MRTFGGHVCPHNLLQVDWKAKCLQAIQAPAGGQIYQALTESLKGSRDAVIWAIFTALDGRGRQ